MYTSSTQKTQADHVVSERERADAMRDRIRLWLGQACLAESLRREELAGLEGIQRHLAISRGYIATMLHYVRINKRADASLAVLSMIAFLCDNNDALCIAGVKRIAQLLDRTERAICDTIERLEKMGCIGVNRPAGKPPSFWIKVPREMELIHANAAMFLNALSDRPGLPGRPRMQPVDEINPRSGAQKPPKSSAENPRSGTSKTPEVERTLSISTKGNTSKGDSAEGSHSQARAADQDTTRLGVEEPEVVEPDEIITLASGKPTASAKRRKGHATGKRPWEWVKDAEKEELVARAKEWASERADEGWTLKYLADRLKAFGLQQQRHPTASADWWADVEIWLMNPHYQPRDSNGSGKRGRASLDELMERAQSMRGGE